MRLAKPTKEDGSATKCTEKVCTAGPTAISTKVNTATGRDRDREK